MVSVRPGSRLHLNRGLFTYCALMVRWHLTAQQLLACVVWYANAPQETRSSASPARYCVTLTTYIGISLSDTPAAPRSPSVCVLQRRDAGWDAPPRSPNVCVLQRRDAGWDGLPGSPTTVAGCPSNDRDWR